MIKMNNKNINPNLKNGAFIKFNVVRVEQYLTKRWSILPHEQLSRAHHTSLIYLNEEGIYYVASADRTEEILQLPEGESMTYRRLAQDTEYAYKRDNSARYWVLSPILEVYHDGQRLCTFELNDCYGNDTIEFDYSQEYDGYTPEEKLLIICHELGVFDYIESLGFDADRVFGNAECLKG